MTHNKFEKDRHLYLTDCLIQKHTIPGSTFHYAHYPYEFLTIDQNIRFIMELDDINWFSDTIGRNIKVLTFIDYFDENVWRIICCFCNLKRINLVHTSITQMIQSCVSFMKKEQISVVFKNMEVIKEKYFQIEVVDNTVSTLSMLNVFPNLKKIISAGFAFKSIETYLSKITRNVFKQGHIYDYRKNHDLQCLLQSPSIFLRKIKFIRGEIKTEKDFKFVAEMCKKYSTIEKIIMWCNNVPRLETDLLTNLSIKLCNSKMDDFYLLEKITGLRKLTIYIPRENQCLKWHKTIVHAGLKCLTIHFGHFNCIKCYHSCITSFHNVIEFSCYLSAKFLNGQGTIFPITAFPKLKKFLIDSEGDHTYCYKLHDELAYYNGVHHFLEYLHLGNITDVKKEDLGNICNIFPNLQNLSLDLFSELMADETLETISKTLRTLRHFNLQIKTSSFLNYDRHEVLENVAMRIKENGVHLRTLCLPSFKRIEKTCIVNFLFNELSQLNFICFGKYISYCKQTSGYNNVNL